jgi:hypothetical protein
MMERFTTLGPGMIWATAQSSTNSSFVIQRFFLDQFALHHGQHAAKALQRQPGEGPEQIGRVCAAGA